VVGLRLDEKDLQILELLQRNCRSTARKIAEEVGSPITTVYAKIKRMERMGLIKGYKAVIDAEKLGIGTTAFILVSFTPGKWGKTATQRDVARKIASFPEVQEVHIITGDWDILLKVKVRDVNELGRLVVDRLRMVEGVEKSLTCVVLATVKETTDLPLKLV